MIDGMLQAPSVLEQVAAILVVAAIVGLLARLLRQPLIIGFIAAGILVGPLALGIVEGSGEVELLARLGVSLLLFIVGLRLDTRLVRTVGPVALVAGLGQVAFTSAVGFVIALGLGFAVVDSLYIAVGLTFSSTIIIVKLLSDKGETNQLHGRIAIGLLIVQDIVVVLLMIVLSALGKADAATGDVPMELTALFVRGAAFLAAVAVVARYVLPLALSRASKSPELLVLVAVAWAVALASVSDLLGSSREVGAFVAGISIATSPFRDAISSRLTGLRDFLLIFFFVELGLYLDLGGGTAQLWPAAVLAVFVLVGNPVIVMVIMGAMRYRKRVSFLTGLTVAQISEFSLVLATLGLSLGHISSGTLGTITIVGIITIASSTYLILYSQPLYERLAPWLRVFERSVPRESNVDEQGIQPDVIVVGLGRFGGEIARSLAESGVSILGVDFDTSALDRLRSVGIPVLYGDADDSNIPEMLPLDRTEWVVSSIRTTHTNVALIHALRDHGYRGRVAVSADFDADAARLRSDGADLVLMPLRDAATDAIRMLRECGT